MRCLNRRACAQLPDFIVHGTSGADDELALIAHGGAVVGGQTSVHLVPNRTPGAPSEAVFQGITLSPAGNYLLEIVSATNSQVFVQQESPIQVGFRLKNSEQLDSTFDAIDSMLKF